MNDGITLDNLTRAFPYALKGTDAIAMMASIVAEELLQLSEDSDLLNIYGRIDELDGEMLDILAYDFKIDWWNANADVSAKRATFKSCFSVHRKLGTIGAVKDALTAEYPSTEIREWYDYNGVPYHYKLEIELGNEMFSTESFRKILWRANFYTNVRSVMDSVSFSSSRTRDLFYGCALKTGILATFNVDGIDIDELVCLTDENDVLLTDELGNILTE